MSEPKRLTDDEVETLVRTYLVRQEESVDAQRILAGVRARARTGRPGGFYRLRAWGWQLAAAAALLGALLVSLQLGTGQASAETLVREARQAHALPVDRGYRIDIEPDPAMLEEYPLLAPKQEMLWTRGDRFWMEASTPSKKWAWGRDSQDRVWLAINPQKGLRFDADEVPEPLAVACDVRCLRVETVLGDFLRDFDLRRERVAPPGEPAVYRIHATLKPGHKHPSLRAALVEIDPDHKILQRLVLWRMVDGKDTAKVTFTLVDTRPQADASYELEGHLGPKALLLTRKEATHRLKALVGHFGLKNLSNKASRLGLKLSEDSPRGSGE
jgi:hypothetical protein